MKGTGKGDINIGIDFVLVRDIKAIANKIKRSVKGINSKGMNINTQPINKSLKGTSVVANSLNNTLSSVVKQGMTDLKSGFMMVNSGAQNLKSTWANASKSAGVFNRDMQRVGAVFGHVVYNGRQRMSRFGNGLRKWFKTFDGWALSLMFLGMAIKQVFTSIWKTGSKTFTEVMKSVGDTTNGFTMLEGSVKYLGFTIGQALEPLASLLIPIIEIIADWILQNETLARKLFIIGIIAGGLLTVFGILWLGLKPIFQGIYMIFAKKLLLPLLLVASLLDDVSGAFTSETSKWKYSISGVASTLLLLLVIFGVISFSWAIVIALWIKTFLHFVNLIIKRWEGITRNFKIIFYGLFLAWKQYFIRPMLEKFQNAVNSVINAFPKIAEKLGVTSIDVVGNFDKSYSDMEDKVLALQDEQSKWAEEQKKSEEESGINKLFGGGFKSLFSAIDEKLKTKQSEEGSPVDGKQDYMSLLNQAINGYDLNGETTEKEAQMRYELGTPSTEQKQIQEVTIQMQTLLDSEVISESVSDKILLGMEKES